MAEHSKISWTDATWNPIAGCSLVSPGCTNCYAMRRVAPRLAANPATPHYAGTVEKTKTGHVWTGKIGIASDRVLTKPLRWKAPRMIFVNSTSDLFHEDVPDAVIDRIFAVMALCPQHVFQVLTKRQERMHAYLSDPVTPFRVAEAALNVGRHLPDGHPGWNRAHWKPSAIKGCTQPAAWPLPNVWLGVSVEDQTRANARIPVLLDTPAALRWISAEPLLGPIDLTLDGLMYLDCPDDCEHSCFDHQFGVWECRRCEDSGKTDDPGLDWVVVGGESGVGARPMHPDWAGALRDQCAEAGVPFHFKQWGDWLPGDFGSPPDIQFQDCSWMDMNTLPDFDDPDVAKNWNDGLDYCLEHEHVVFKRVGKERAGRLLDGVLHDAWPEVAR